MKNKLILLLGGVLREDEAKKIEILEAQIELLNRELNDSKNREALLIDMSRDKTPPTPAQPIQTRPTPWMRKKRELEVADIEKYWKEKMENAGEVR